MVEGFQALGAVLAIQAISWNPFWVSHLGLGENTSWTPQHQRPCEPGVTEEMFDLERRSG